MIIGYATWIRRNQYASMEYRFSDHASGLVLDGVPFQGAGDGNPPINERSKLISVVWDTNPRANSIDITLHDFYWPGDRDLVLRGVHVPAGY